MKRINGKELAIDILIDFVGGFLIAVGIYNFAAKAQFPMSRVFRNCIDFLSSIFFRIPIRAISYFAGHVVFLL